MNKKFLICGLLATGLILTACVKKEPPKDENQEQVDATTQEQQPTEFKPLQSTENNQPSSTAEQTVVIERMETPNTTTEVRREQHHTPRETEPTTPKKEEPKVDSTASAESANTPSQSSRQNSNQSRSEDDAVADAIAAATPALKN